MTFCSFDIRSPFCDRLVLSFSSDSSDFRVLRLPNARRRADLYSKLRGRDLLRVKRAVLAKALRTEAMPTARQRITEAIVLLDEHLWRTAPRRDHKDDPWWAEMGAWFEKEIKPDATWKNAAWKSDPPRISRRRVRTDDPWAEMGAWFEKEMKPDAAWKSDLPPSPK
jgi:hypothetical protein